jgi:hypothetical protein
MFTPTEIQREKAVSELMERVNCIVFGRATPTPKKDIEVYNDIDFRFSFLKIKNRLSQVFQVTETDYGILLAKLPEDIYILISFKN